VRLTLERYIELPEWRQRLELLESPVNDQPDPEAAEDLELEIVELLDERFRLREDPDRTSELEDTHLKLREALRKQIRPEPVEKTEE
jgi:hypothetical protein